jgi:hypothetical protein
MNIKFLIILLTFIIFTSCIRESPKLEQFEVEVIGFLSGMPLILFNNEDINTLEQITGIKGQNVFLANNLDIQLQKDGLDLIVIARKPQPGEVRTGYSPGPSLPEIAIIHAKRK